MPFVVGDESYHSAWLSASTMQQRKEVRVMPEDVFFLMVLQTAKKRPTKLCVTVRSLWSDQGWVAFGEGVVMGE